MYLDDGLDFRTLNEMLYLPLVLKIWMPQYIVGKLRKKSPKWKNMRKKWIVGMNK